MPGSCPAQAHRWDRLSASPHRGAAGRSGLTACGAAAAPAKTRRHGRPAETWSGQRCLRAPRLPIRPWPSDDRQTSSSSRSRAATAHTFSPAAPSASAAKITGAAYLSRDSKKPGNSTCVRPQPPRKIARRGRTSRPANVDTRRGGASPHGRSVPPHQQASRLNLSRASTDSSEPRTVTTVIPPAPRR